MLYRCYYYYHSFLFSVIFDYSKYTLFQNKYSQLKSWRCIYLCIKSCTTLAKKKFWAFGSVRALFTVYWTVHVTCDPYSVPTIPNCKWSPDHKWSSTANDPLKSWIGMDFRDFRNGWWQERIFSLDSDWKQMIGCRLLKQKTHKDHKTKESTKW